MADSHDNCTYFFITFINSGWNAVTRTYVGAEVCKEVRVCGRSLVEVMLHVISDRTHFTYCRVKT